jgi:hypothetical protein
MHAMSYVAWLEPYSGRTGVVVSPRLVVLAEDGLAGLHCTPYSVQGSKVVTQFTTSKCGLHETREKRRWRVQVDSEIDDRFMQVAACRSAVAGATVGSTEGTEGTNGYEASNNVWLIRKHGVASTQC